MKMQKFQTDNQLPNRFQSILLVLNQYDRFLTDLNFLHFLGILDGQTSRSSSLNLAF